MRQRVFHRGVTIENHTGDSSCWRATVCGNEVQGELDVIRKCVDWSTEMRTFISPKQVIEHLNSLKSRQKPERRLEVHQGIKIMNDSGKDSEWYIMVKGRLFKGTLVAVKSFLDKNIDKIKA
uniref:DUF3319 domain-containing protein n=1 Tax=Thaumasiovibrio occultus TaxID=1891184 RepID=UPI000B363CBA|nr:DUF3319 domain-containing protein [Thaumasiovibrio occultus]